jgi:hypothetical protein
MSRNKISDEKQQEVLDKLSLSYYEDLLIKIDKGETVRRTGVVFVVNAEDPTDDGLYFAFHTIGGPKNILSVGTTRIETITDATPEAGRKLARIFRKFAYAAEQAAKKKDH